jgi:hypothetical protein
MEQKTPIERYEEAHFRFRKAATEYNRARREKARWGFLVRWTRSNQNQTTRSKTT